MPGNGNIPNLNDFSTFGQYINALSDWIDRTEAEEPGSAARILSDAWGKSLAAAGEYILWVRHQKKAMCHGAFIDSEIMGIDQLQLEKIAPPTIAELNCSLEL